MTWDRNTRYAAYFFFTYTILFFFYFLFTGSMEFLLYVGVNSTLACILAFSYIKGVRYAPCTVWGLAVWGLLHMLGGSVPWGDSVLYNVVFFELIGEPYSILKYDQVVHTFGFAVATLVVFDIVRGETMMRSLPRLLFLVIFAGTGLGALNEIIEFFATISIEHVYVGGYENTVLDLLFNLIGASFAGCYIAHQWYREKSKSAVY